MAVAISTTYTPEERERIFQHVISRLTRDKVSVAKILAEDEDMPSENAFYRWLRDDPEASTAVERAREIAATRLLEEIPEIAENVKEDKNAIAKAKLMIYARESYAARIASKKYGAKVDVTSGGEKLEAGTTTNNDNRVQSIFAIAQQRKREEEEKLKRIMDE